MKKKLIAYLSRNDFTKDDAKKLTHVNVAFGRVHTDGTIDESHSVNENIAKYKSWNPELKFILSLVVQLP